jgi:hypothetical protein
MAWNQITPTKTQQNETTYHSRMAEQSIVHLHMCMVLHISCVYLGELQACVSKKKYVSTCGVSHFDMEYPKLCVN